MSLYVVEGVYPHEVPDTWLTTLFAQRRRGPARFVRYADDFVLLFRNEEDAQRVFAELPGRFEEYGLKLHTEKTCLIEYRQPPYRPRVSFDFLGFTLYWGDRAREAGP